MRNILHKIKQQVIALSPYVRHPVKSYRRINKRLKASRKIFIDCGTNTGQVLSAFLKDHPTYEYHAFEPQPELSEGLEALVERHPDTSITLYKNAVWTRNENKEFFLATEWGPNYKGGSTLLSDHTNNLSKVDYDQPVMIEAIDFNHWFINELRPKVDDYVIIKMDIEGAEYDVLEKMIDERTIEFVSELIVEFHHQMIDHISIERHNALVKKLNGHKILKLILWH